ncbi:MAG: hypothetical protein HYY38_06220 [Rhodospirillales bacterium]|nr:hypothetical protein [Rhodospirillales bacterium]
MAKPPDLDALARRYLDLWQEQLGGVGKDAEAAEVMARTIELMNAGAAAFAAMAASAAARESSPAGGKTRNDHDATPFDRRDIRSEPPGPASAAAARGAPDHDLAELARRLGRIEKRLAALESGPKKRRRRAAKKPRRR